MDDATIAVAKKAGKLANLEKAIADAPAAAVDHRHRPHPLGHPRGAQRRQRAPAPRVRAAGSRWCTTGSSRTSPSCGPGSRPTTTSSLVSETDTEVAAQLLELQLDSDVDLTEAMQRVCEQLEGAFTLVAVDALDPPGSCRPAQLAAGRRARRRRELPRLRRGGVHRAHPRGARARPGPGRHDHPRGGRGHRLPRAPAGGAALPRRLGPVGRREGGPRLVHAQGDLRAAARGRGLAARAAYRRRAAAPRRDAAVGPGAPRHRQDHHHRVRDVVLRRHGREVRDRALDAGCRSRSSWPRSSATATRSSTTRRSSWRSRSRARPPTPCRRSGTRGPSARRCSRSATPTARRSRASPTRSSTPTPARRSGSPRPRGS